MENKKLIVFFALLFSAVFSMLYYVIFSMTIPENKKEERVLYMNQVGLYEKQDSVTKTQNALKKDGFTPFAMKQNDLTAVVCSVSSEELTTKSQQEKLKKLNYNFIVKQVRIDDQDIIALIDQQEYGKALERIGK